MAQDACMELNLNPFKISTFNYFIIITIQGITMMCFELNSMKYVPC